MADGIALQGIELVLDNLPLVLKEPTHLEGRARMLLASAMGATAFQKGLGAAHAMANALTAQNNLHHGTGIALSLPATIQWLESSALNEAQQQRLACVRNLMRARLGREERLSRLLHRFISETGIPMGLEQHGFTADMVPALSQIAYEDPSHRGNMIPLTRGDFAPIFEAALPATL